MKRVLVSDNLADAGLELFRQTAGIEVDDKPGISADELASIIGEYHGLAIRSGTQVTAQLLEKAVKLEVVGRAGIGVDNIDIPVATARGIVVMNTPGGNTVTTAEHTLALLMSVSRNIPQATASMKAGKWEKKKLGGRELFNKTLGVVGLGNIGRVVANRAKGLKMKVIAFDPFLTEEAAARLEVELVDLDSLFRRSDYITVHVPLNDETRHLIDAAALEKMKTGVFIINCARGGIVDESALADALESGKIGGAAFDVFESEPPPADHPLLAQERFVCSPHLGASTQEAQANVAIAVAEQISAFLTTGEVRNAVNMPSLTREALKTVGPFIDLAERLGSLVGQLGPRPASQVAVTIAGEVNQHPVKPIAIAALRGLLSQQLDVPVNYVNAVHLANDRGLEFEERIASSAREFVSLVTVKATGPDGSIELSGTIFGRKEPRLVRYDTFHLEAFPEGHILVLYNHDRPGVVGQLGSILGAAKVNISRMQVALDRDRGEALALVNVDELPDDATMTRLREIDHMISVRRATL